MTTKLKPGDQVTHPEFGACTVNHVSQIDGGVVIGLNGYLGVYPASEFKKIEFKKQSVLDEATYPDPDLVEEIESHIDKVLNSKPLEQKIIDPFPGFTELPTVRIPKSLYKVIEDNAKKNCRTISQEVWFYLKEYIDEEVG